ncbi:unnamed protein product, partial [Mesorhabditis spiculigera]
MPEFLELPDEINHRIHHYIAAMDLKTRFRETTEGPCSKTQEDEPSLRIANRTTQGLLFSHIKVKKLVIWIKDVELPTKGLTVRTLMIHAKNKKLLSLLKACKPDGQYEGVGLYHPVEEEAVFDFLNKSTVSLGHRGVRLNELLRWKVGKAWLTSAKEDDFQFRPCYDQLIAEWREGRREIEYLNFILEPRHLNDTFHDEFEEMLTRENGQQLYAFKYENQIIVRTLP